MQRGKIIHIYYTQFKEKRKQILAAGWQPSTGISCGPRHQNTWCYNFLRYLYQVLHSGREKVRQMFLSYLLQKVDDSDKIWYAVPWINLQQSNVNVSYLTWIVCLHHPVKRKGSFCQKSTDFRNMKHLVNIWWLQHTIVCKHFHMLELKQSFVMAIDQHYVTMTSEQWRLTM